MTCSHGEDRVQARRWQRAEGFPKQTAPPMRTHINLSSLISPQPCSKRGRSAGLACCAGTLDGLSTSQGVGVVTSLQEGEPLT